MLVLFLISWSSSVFKLSQRSDITAKLPDDFDWSLFASQDPTPFKNMASTSRITYARRLEPSKTQRSALSPLQLLMKESRRTIIDPLISSFPPLSSDEEEEPPDPEELRRAREREKIRELKQRRIHGSSAYAGLGLRKPVDAVYVREDIADESAEVDIDADVKEHNIATTASTSELVIPMEINTPTNSLLASPVDNTESKSRRQQRPARKATAEPVKVQGKAKTKSKAAASHDDDVPMEEVDESKPTEPSLDKKGKPRPETYKQAWSVSEQHLLERLLEEIPEGEKNRWAKISKAMNGRRTARQVASRVQKYYEKLKRFGLEVGK
ncbi:hypothetical protein C8Q75DRAFT_770273 [Abortiporus biennis]|nr:hypothetical protein C8Q75DRAFT_770273 [Abortiporus biennis]